jgi:hypothetical protein
LATECGLVNNAVLLPSPPASVIFENTKIICSIEKKGFKE